MSLIFAVTTLLWFIVALFDYGEFGYIWQLKEYRLDRFKDFLSTVQGKEFLKSYLISGRLGLFIVLIFLFFFKVSIFLPAVLLLTILELSRIIYKILKKQIRYPKRTAKALLIVFIAVLIEFAAWFLVKDVKIMFLLYCSRFFILTFIVGLFYLPTKLIKSAYIIIASKKMFLNPQVKVIGITGSFGKTTVKNYLKQILGAKYNVVATPKNINTEIGIAKFISKTDFSKVDIFIVEMGAYRMGEIKQICDMVRPKIGILTAINEQHLSLFGDIKKTQKAKFELLDSLPADGLAITNSDNQYCRELLPKLKCEYKTFGQNPLFAPNAHIADVKTDQEKINFNIEFDKENLHLEAKVLGQHNVMNIAPVVIIAKTLGFNNQEIIEQVAKLEAPEGTLRALKYGESVVIDDSYNSNPDGFLAAINILKNYSSDYRKLVITRGMLELGEKSSELHQKIGAEIAKNADELIVISRDSEADLKKGAGEKIKIISCFSPDELLKLIQQSKTTRSIILLENRMPGSVLNELKS
ncbi:MAG: UDP-N-acetylmuramoyl-tripeptide-D-alanyl-D-alanine ligase [Parcubacteria group bacterium GW2011_GWE2_39_37]|uniref:UDP-N-acetylmuramoyl-tripeptide-D-alanyl-D-alanine ligase n=1 Tax=Candidatus Falkowbacteria bacterium GW2011_GWF2_39_8 TaxID=1618642 RepID=A0A0G0Q2Z9_9BACT|nr:MAG: UDP-N-acetylmuramoyl-tripeptide-D-alanyl-D-alanine ligase [Parcubacteria group bacterium GW2011_GWE2_39_37]KKR31741.1 MAG: UDP-N-acetylmuramoyl-tripeptide-D-alanyl-D-alanine ligase [Candidatus Falkowbacteria bacterium GW2011_GWF2_39_8]